MMAVCVLCSKSLDLDHRNDFAKLTEKGCIAINNASKMRKLKRADLEYSADSELYVHKSCRSNHTNPKAIKLALKREAPLEVDQKVLRSKVSDFDFKTHCFFCGIIVDKETAKKHPERTSLQYSRVMTLELQNND